VNSRGGGKSRKKTSIATSVTEKRLEEREKLKKERITRRQKGLDRKELNLRGGAQT